MVNPPLEEANEKKRWKYTREREIESTLCGKWQWQCVRGNRRMICGDDVQEEVAE